MEVKKVLERIKNENIKFVDLRFTDTKGKEQHVTLPTTVFDENKFTSGQVFDGSSIAGWKGIEASDMLLKPDANQSYIDPFFEQTTLVLTCDVYDPNNNKEYERDPRSLAKRAEVYLQSTGLGDQAYFGPEPEFFIFDSISWNNEASGCFVEIKADGAPWSNAKTLEHNNTGHRPAIKGGYFPVPPVDHYQDMRSEITLLLEKIGIPVEVHHHEVAGAGQNEIGTRFSTLVQRADWTMAMKYIIQNVAHNYGKTATFMPKPVVGDNGSGMHVHQSVWKNGKNLFSGNEYNGLSEFALHYIGGIIFHARALNAFTNPTTNSYKRLMPGFEAPVKLAYSSCNRSASIRIPYANCDHARRIEVRFPDAMANPYLAFSALMMAGLDGVKHKRHPGEAVDKNLYNLPWEESKKINSVCASLEEALFALDEDRSFLKEGNVFSDSLIDAYIQLKMEEVNRFKSATHPVEFDMYYSL